MRKTDSEGQGERDTDIVREARKAVQRGKERERPCREGTCQGEGDRDGVLVLHTERALRPEASQGPTNQTEILYIFFGIHKANVLQLADRIEQRAQLAVL